ncbi:MAG: glycerol-3-phosphate dehydrogenase/oxidase [Flavobacteriaceae bacterium]|nr:glycerol-3-phosphate dehydrogenase/oxidase [Flavobacteriaceae bacterium]
MQPFSYQHRTSIIDQCKTEDFDMLIIGGGVTGAGIALDAATRGLKVLLIEKNDFASGTSSKSTKLIHGGLRYLKQFDFWLVREVGTERAIVHKLAPHLVVPKKMLLPIIENGTYSSWLTSIGLKIYDVLANVEGDDKRQMLNKKEAIRTEPLLPESLVEGAGYYAEYRTDDARLTIEIIKTAVYHSAKAMNYCEAKSFIYNNKEITGAVAFDKITQHSFEINARYVINATGPWVDNLREKTSLKETFKKRLQLTKGVHLVFPFEKFPVKQSIYFDVPDGRMIFAVPRGKITYVGTTDTNYQGDIDQIEVNLVDALYLISAVNHMFQDIDLNLDDVVSSWAGLRPLIQEEGKSVSELSRKDEIFESDSGLISIAGGKLTGYRKMAERVTDLVCHKINKTYDKKTRTIQTEHLTLEGGSFKNYKAVQRYIQTVFEQIKNDGFDIKDIEILVHKFGQQTAAIIQKFHELTDEDVEIRMAKAELWFCLNYEMTLTPLDFFTRRTGRLFFEIQSLHKLKMPILEVFREHFDWDQDTFDKHANEIDLKIFKACHFE